MNNNDTIVALSTGRGGAIAVIRVTGARGIEITDKCFESISNSSLLTKKGFTINYGNFKNSANERIDDVIVSLFRAPKSYTGEDMVEISCHASEYIIGEIISVLIENGACMASPGEFTQRAYLNHKMDIVQAEAVADMITATSKASHTLAMNQMRGGYSSEFSDLRAQLLHFISMLELELDFSEEDVEFVDRVKLKELLNSIYIKIKSLVNSFKQGNAIKNGVPVAIVGAPNAGKSTLLNSLLKEERAIVSSIAGTTRDSIEETLNLGGVLFRFIDTAGIRETNDELESIGIKRTIDSVRKAQIIMFVLDTTESLSQLTEHFSNLASQTSFDEKDIFLILNKSDLSSQNDRNAIKKALSTIYSKVKIFEVSASNNLSVDTIESYLSKEYSVGIHSESVVISNMRHLKLLSSAMDSTERALNALNANIPTDLISGDIRETIHHLGTLTGDISTDDILENIFKNFCIGK